MHILNSNTNAALSEDEVRLAEASSRALRHLFGTEDAHLQRATLRVSVERPNGETAELALPGAALPLLSAILKEWGYGRTLVVLATDTEVTLPQAADFLNVSRPAIGKLLEEGKLPFRKAGTRRRIRLHDLLRYKEQEETARHQGLDELAAEAQKLGMY